MGEEKTGRIGRGEPTPELGQFFELTANLTEEQKKWPVARLVPSDCEGVALLVRADAPPRQAQVLPAVADMLTAGRASDAETIFAHIRAAGLSLKTDLGADGVLHVTLVGA